MKVLCAAFLQLRFGFVTKEKLHKALLCEKFASKMLMKLTPKVSNLPTIHMCGYADA